MQACRPFQSALYRTQSNKAIVPYMEARQAQREKQLQQLVLNTDICPAFLQIFSHHVFSCGCQWWWQQLSWCILHHFSRLVLYGTLCLGELKSQTCNDAFMPSQAHPTTLLSCRLRSRCVNGFNGFVSAFIFATETQQTIGTDSLFCAIRVAQCHTMLRPISVQCIYALCHQDSNYLLIRVWSQISNRLLAISMDCGLTIHLGSNPECHHTGYHLCPHQSAQAACQNNIHLRLRRCCSSRWNAEVHVSGSRHPHNPGQPSYIL